MRLHMAFLLLAFILTVACAHPQSTEERSVTQSETKTGPEGSRSVKREVCTERPPSSYNDTVKALLDSALKLPDIEIGKLVLEFGKNVDTFFENTPEGADLASTLFYICQISSNRKFSEKTTSDLIEKAIDAYNAHHKAKISYEDVLKVVHEIKVPIPDVLQIVDLRLDDTPYQPASLELLMRNTGGQVAVLKRADLYIQRIWDIPLSNHAAQLHVSSTHDFRIPTNVFPLTLSAYLANTVPANGADRLRFLLASTDTSVFMEHLILASLSLVYDEDNKVISSKPLLFVSDSLGFTSLLEAALMSEDISLNERRLSLTTGTRHILNDLLAVVDKHKPVSGGRAQQHLTNAAKLMQKD